MSGKGDDRRPASVDEKEFATNWDRIFGNKIVGVGVTGSTASSNLAGSRSSLEPPATYVDDASGQEVNESWWPGDPIEPNT